MGSRFFIRNFILFGLLASGNMQIPVGELDNNLDLEMAFLLEVTRFLGTILGLQSVTVYTGCIDINPSIQRSLMDRYIPVNTVGSNLKRVDNHKLANEKIRIVIFTGLHDPILSTLNATKVRYSNNMYILVYASPNKNKSVELDFIEEVFTLLWNMSIDYTFLLVHGEFKMEIWNYFYLGKIHKYKVTRFNTFLASIRKYNFKFVLQVIDDPPSIFWYNSSDQADVTGGGNISVSGPIGLLIINFMRHLNVTTDIIPVPGKQNFQFESFQQPDDWREDNATHIVGSAILKYSPVVMHSRLCLLVSNRRMVPFSRFLDKLVRRGVYRLILVSSVGILVIKYFSHHHRSFTDAFFSTIRFFLGIPLPNNVLNRLPRVDRWTEVFIILLVNILLSSNISITSSALTTGFWEPPITNVETMRASGLRIMTEDPSIPQAFKENILPSSLADLVLLVDEATFYHHVTTLNNSYVYVVHTHNWAVFRLYQEQLAKEPFQIAGKELCSKWRILGLPLNPKSPLRFLLKEYSRRVLESGLWRKWIHMGFKKFCDFHNLNKLPVDSVDSWQPLSIEFFSNFLRAYILGSVLATLAFVFELVHNRYRRRNE
ncbi:uncharacterized protein LOC6547290 [Drosophila erecta]|uniref:Ionotropic glutamate receptor C-terminal domain-containing protein n=1 Tax=Drosophila erecta TaxID=7220 RepID=B3NKF0_DROER|nr:uncharacterized protein LOC6547290 [Drosophila erecta]EDV55172.1 uncharacterized protein Dere_GG20923 [Drosophila erecta]